MSSLNFPKGQEWKVKALLFHLRPHGDCTSGCRVTLLTIDIGAVNILADLGVDAILPEYVGFIDDCAALLVTKGRRRNSEGISLCEPLYIRFCPIEGLH